MGFQRTERGKMYADTHTHTKAEAHEVKVGGNAEYFKKAVWKVDKREVR